MAAQTRELKGGYEARGLIFPSGKISLAARFSSDKFPASESLGRPASGWEDRVALRWPMHKEGWFYALLAEGLPPRLSFALGRSCHAIPSLSLDRPRALKPWQAHARGLLGMEQGACRSLGKKDGPKQEACAQGRLEARWVLLRHSRAWIGLSHSLALHAHVYSSNELAR